MKMLQRIVHALLVVPKSGCIRSFTTALLLTAFAGFADAGPTAQLRFIPASPQEYEPFRVIATFSEDVCLSTNAPGYAQVRFAGNLLDIQLSHLKAGSCSRQREFQFNGLPAGSHTVQLGLTSRRPQQTGDAYDGGSTLLIAIGSAPLSILSRADFATKYWFTGRIDGDSIFHPYQITEGGGGPVVIWGSHGEPLTGGGDWLDVGPPTTSGFTFQAWTPISGSAEVLPREPKNDAFEAIYRYNYPNPSQGAFMTTEAECLAATRLLFLPTASVCAFPVGYVLKYRNGACPFGASPVYRLFHPVSIAHRYVQSADTYVALQSYGYVGEGPQFCAPKRSDGVQ